MFRTGGKLLEFVKDLHSGKLHQNFHNPPPSTTTQATANVIQQYFTILLFFSKKQKLPIYDFSRN